MDNQDIVRFWGEHSLKRWTAQTLSDLGASDSSKRFLRDVGMPIGVDWTLQFDDAADSLPREPRHISCRRIGVDYACPVCIDEAHDGAVVVIEGDRKIRFINVDVPRFGECLVHYQQYRIDVRGMGDDEVEMLIKITDQKIRRADEQAFDNPENWWPVVVEQMRDGLL